MRQTEKELEVYSNAFKDNGFIPKKYTGRGEDISPDFLLNHISKEGKSMAIVMDDEDHPFSKITGQAYNHWLIWNIPIQSKISEHIEHGEVVNSLLGAIQGIGYGKHRYKGPKPPFFIKRAHRYTFHIYILDCALNLKPAIRKKEFIQEIQHHILQHVEITALFKNE